MTQQVTFAKLHNGDWGVFGPVDLLETGNVVTVTKKSGATCKVTIGKMVWDNDMEGVATIAPKKTTEAPKPVAPARTDEPEPGKVYRLTGDSSTPSVMRGDSLADCEVVEDVTPKEERSDFARECEQWLESPTGKAYRGIETEDPVKPSEPASEALNGWGVCTDCDVPGIRDVSGLGLSCGCAF